MSEQPNNTPEQPEEQPTSKNNVDDIREEITIAGSELVDKVKELVAEGNVRRLIVRKQDGDILIEVPLTASVIAGGAVLVINPILAGLGALAAFFAKLRLEVVRTGEKAKNDDKQKIDLD